jgi:DNA-binding MarR family transcriptional regulator
MAIASSLRTELRHLLDLAEGSVAEACIAVGLKNYKPRFSPVLRALVEQGPSSIGGLARAISVTHSAASQTVAQMGACGLVALEPGEDARQRIVSLTPKTESILPAVQAEWAATDAAAAQLDAELPLPLGEVVAALSEALQRRSFRQRVADAALGLKAESHEPHGEALADGRSVEQCEIHGPWQRT